MYGLFDELLLPIGLCFGSMVLAIAALFAGLDYLDCAGFQSGTGIETRWRWGCYAKQDGAWMPKEFVFGKANELRIKDKE